MRTTKEDAMAETRSETTREARREGEQGRRPTAEDTEPSAPEAASARPGGTERQPDPSSGGDLRHDQRLKGGSTGSSGG
jgi:hypothetical protein